MGVRHWHWLSAELQEHQTPAGRSLRPTNNPIPNRKISTSQNMMAAYFALSVLLFNSALALPQNFEDIDLASDQPDGEVVDINQADPQSNAIHVAHNIPKDSDITVVQTNPFNTSVHISMNGGTGSK